MEILYKDGEASPFCIYILYSFLFISSFDGPLNILWTGCKSKFYTGNVFARPFFDNIYNDAHPGWSRYNRGRRSTVICNNCPKIYSWNICYFMEIFYILSWFYCWWNYLFKRNKFLEINMYKKKSF